MGRQTGGKLEIQDTFYLGRFALMQNKLEIAKEWLEEASLQAVAEGFDVKEEYEAQRNCEVEQLDLLACENRDNSSLQYKRFMQVV